MTYDHSTGDYHLADNKSTYESEMRDYYNSLPEPPRNVWTAPGVSTYPYKYPYGDLRNNQTVPADHWSIPKVTDITWTTDPNDPDYFVRDKEEDPAKKQVGGDHYKKMKIQPMDYIEANDLNWAEGNVIKYVTRHSYKNGKEDLEKAIHMLEMIIKSRYS